MNFFWATSFHDVLEQLFEGFVLYLGFELNLVAALKIRLVSKFRFLPSIPLEMIRKPIVFWEFQGGVEVN